MLFLTFMKKYIFIYIFPLFVNPGCPPLRVAPGVSVVPPTCTHDKMRAGVVCSFSCNHGYRVHGPPIKECTDRGTWTDGHMNISCTG